MTHLQVQRALVRRHQLKASRSAVALIASVAIGASLTAVPASASSYPSYPTAVRVLSASPSSFTVTASRSANATGYRLFASTTKTQVYVANIAQAKRSAVSTTPTVSLRSLPYSTSTWYYRFGAVNSRGIRYSPILSTNLQPASPTGLTFRSSAGGTTLTWRSGAASSFRVAQSTDVNMQANRVNYNISSQARQFTPYGLQRGKRYYFRIAALNGRIGSHYSAGTASGVAGAREQSARVLTYNVQEANLAGVRVGDQKVAAWSQRRAGVAHFIRAAGADLVGVQEAAAWVGSVQGYGGKRQIDDLTGMLSSTYALARTEVPPTQHGYRRTGNYILYNKAKYTTSGAGGFWFIGVTTAAYQVVKNRSTGARLLFVSAHLSPGHGTAGDNTRLAESRSLIRQATALASAQHVPVVYTGDFNSYKGAAHPLDGPGRAFDAVHATDALQVAQSRVNAQYNSANQNVHKPLAAGLSIDHVFAPAGVALRSWHQWLELKNGAYAGTFPSDHNAISVDVTFPVR